MDENNGKTREAETVKVVTVSLYAEDLLELEVLARTSGSGRSGALRRIIREWREQREPRPAVETGEQE